MNLSIAAQAVTMTSREIAELTGKDHKNVRRDIELMLKALKKDALSFERIYQDSMNRQQTEYALDEEHTLCLTSGYDVNQRMAIIRQWKAMTAAVALPSYAETLRLYADQLEENQRQSEQLAIAAPKVAFVDSYVEATGLMGFRQVAKLLSAKEHGLSRFLEDERIMYRLGGRLTPYAQHIDAQRFEMRTGTGGVMIRCPDCIAEHCACIAR